MSRTLSFRVLSRTDRSEHHTVQVDGKAVSCSCNGVDWCSHIDATLVAGERAMVPESDRRTADVAMRRLSGILKPPAGWLATWRDDRVWGGLAAARDDRRGRHRIDGRPTVIFAGGGDAGNRDEYVDQALSLGWRVVDAPDEFTTVAVVTPDSSSSARIARIAALDIPTISHSDWDEWIYDFTNAILDRIEHHAGGAPARR